ncbi:hypothetical protein GCM10025880_13050 [Methylorubrum aminovorans]|nr:hypothetical protein GCM10025880_13050 [Methylorubrum aminovorans]
MDGRFLLIRGLERTALERSRANGAQHLSNEFGAGAAACEGAYRRGRLGNRSWISLVLWAVGRTVDPHEPPPPTARSQDRRRPTKSALRGRLGRLGLPTPATLLHSDYGNELASLRRDGP